MPKCTNCHNQWTWGQTLKVWFTLDTGMICPYCGQKQFSTKKSRNRINLMGFLVTSPLLLQLFFDLSAFILIVLFLVIPVLLVASVPYQIVLTDRDEFLS